MLILLVLLLFAAPAVAHMEHAQVEPRIQRWLLQQQNPVSKISCCDQKDAEQVEEDIREGVYWVRSDMTRGQWVRVPPENVLKNPNLHGRPVAWFRHQMGGVFVFCYAPGALL